MKPFFLTLFSLVLFLTADLAVLAAEPPAIPIGRAVELAQQALAEKGAPKDVYIQSVTLLRSSMISSKAVWQVLWSNVVPGSKEDTQELGVQVGMSGDVVHILRGRGGVQKPFLAH